MQASISICWYNAIGSIDEIPERGNQRSLRSGLGWGNKRGAKLPALNDGLLVGSCCGGSIDVLVSRRSWTRCIDCLQKAWQQCCK